MENINLEVSANGCVLSLAIAGSMIDGAILKGFDKTLLRWRVGRGQLRGIQYLMITMSDPRMLLHLAENGGSESGMLMGVPYSLDILIPDDEIILETAEVSKRIGSIRSLAVPRRLYIGK